LPTASYISYAAAQSALALIDIDTKGMPDTVRERIKEAGGFWGALVSVLPELETTGRIVRRSTSTGIIRTDTGEALPGSNGLHVYVHVRDGGDIERFLRTLHERCWLKGFGWHMVGAGGQLLDRSIVDRMVYAGERLVFEGPPMLVPPLEQDQEARRPIVFDHPPVDTKEACQPLRIVEQSELDNLKARSANILAPARAKERDRFIEGQTERLVKRTGISEHDARRVVERQCEGILLPDVVLPWDDAEFTGCTVADILKDPARFVGATMADPLEGTDYGPCKAMVMRRPDGTPWIHSFAHGRTVYELRYDARAADAAIAAAPPDQVADVFVRMVSNADLDSDQQETLRNRVADITGVGKRTLDNKLKASRQKQAAQRVKAERHRKAAERRDPRPQIPAPYADAPWLPQMGVMNDVMGSSAGDEPPMRDMDGVVTQVRARRIPNMHALTEETVNEDGDPKKTLPPPEQPLLTRLDEIRLSELIETHIDYVNPDGQSVHLASPFVKHFLERFDDALPIVTAIATLPIVMPDGTLLAKRGLDRKRGIVFRVPPQLLSIIPNQDDCTPAAVAAAMRFLMDEWLCDVATDYTGRCILIAAALTIIERSLLSDRPAFFVAAGRRGGGKTTTLVMLMMAVTGERSKDHSRPAVENRSTRPNKVEAPTAGTARIATLSGCVLHPRPWHRGSVFGDGPRRPLDREQRARIKYLLNAHSGWRRLLSLECRGECGIGVRDRKCFRLELIADPLKLFVISRMGWIGEDLDQFGIAPGTAAILGRAVALSGGAGWPCLRDAGRRRLLDQDVMLPAIAKVIGVKEPGHAGSCQGAQAQTALVGEGLVIPIVRVARIAIPSAVNVKIMKVAMLYQPIAV
jgi:hypothetical protein